MTIMLVSGALAAVVFSSIVALLARSIGRGGPPNEGPAPSGTGRARARVVLPPQGDVIQPAVFEDVVGNVVVV